MLNTPRQSALILSKGTVLDTTWPAIRDDFPDGSSTELRFYDSSGTVISVVPGAVEPKRLVYMVPTGPDLDDVPNGSQYELFIITDDGPYKYEYGTVIRREAAFYTPPPTSLEGNSRLFKDALARNAVGRRWVATRGGITMHNLGGTPVKYGMGPDTGLLFSEAGIRYFRPLGGDSWRIKFSIYYSGSAFGSGGQGKIRVHMGCDIALTTGMGFEIEVGSSTSGKVHTGLVTSPTDLTITGTVDNAVVSGDTWTVEYSDLTKLLQAFKGPDPTGTTPIITWEDTGNVLPHGPGFRYWGFSWDASLLATGPTLMSVEAQDYV